MTLALQGCRCLQCYGHILNLAARVFLWGTNSNSFEREVAVQTTLQDEQAQLQLWQKNFFFSKLCNIVVYVCRSLQRCEQFITLYAKEEMSNGIVKPDKQLV